MVAAPAPETVALCVERYRELKNLKLVSDATGIPWQTVYTHLKRAGEPVTGDKQRYGSETDRLAARAERWFAATVPWAVDLNQERFQAKVDFRVGEATVDVKVARPRTSKTGVLRWTWSLRKQVSIADHFVCLALVVADGDLHVSRVLLVPGDVARFHTAFGVSFDGTFKGKWSDYVITPSDLRDFFQGIVQ